MPRVPFWIKVHTDAHRSHSQKCSTFCGGFRSLGLDVVPPCFATLWVSTRNNRPSRSRRNGFKHCELAQWLSILSSSLPFLRVRRQTNAQQQAGFHGPCTPSTKVSELFLFLSSQHFASPRSAACRCIGTLPTLRLFHSLLPQPRVATISTNAHPGSPLSPYLFRCG